MTNNNLVTVSLSMWIAAVYLLGIQTFAIGSNASLLPDLSAKTDDERKSEIYKAVVKEIDNQTQRPKVSLDDFMKYRALDPVEVTNKIFEKEKLMGQGELNAWWIEFEVKRQAGILPGSQLQTK
jgi:hypothetical protein